MNRAKHATIAVATMITAAVPTLAATSSASASAGPATAAPGPGASGSGPSRSDTSGSDTSGSDTGTSGTGTSGTAASGTGTSGTAASGTGASGTGERSQVDFVAASGDFRPPAAATNAYSYDARLVPADASIAVGAVYVETAPDKVQSIVKLQVRRLVPNRVYGAHVHYLPCGATGAAAGAHYQNVPDPAVGDSRTKASTDPAYARPGNEVWLDFTTDKQGDATAETTMDWKFRPGEARSLVIHEHHTSQGGTGHPHAGDAGGRLGCLTVPF